MRSANIWAVALAATLSLACDNGNVNDDMNTGANRTGATDADRTPGTANPTGTSATNQATARDPGAAATMARANDADNDRAFVEKIAQANFAEARLGQLAAERASSPQVKQFGQRMTTDHQKANAELKQIASKMAVQLPTELDAKHKQLHDRLSKLKGAEFDKEYMQAMVDGHQEVLTELERQAGSGERSVGTSGSADQTHASVTDYAKKMLPDVQKHLEQAKQINAK
jgi:putative membrane protein